MLQYQEIISKMTLEEKASMMSGQDTWRTKDYKKMGIPAMFLSDGPHGLRKQAVSCQRQHVLFTIVILMLEDTICRMIQIASMNTRLNYQVVL